jgi:hypothetical protein
MLESIRDWLGFAMSALHSILFLSEWMTTPRRRVRRKERYRHFKLWGIEWTAYDREDDDQS